MISAAVDARIRLRQRAEEDAVAVFAKNLKDLLLAAPAGTRTTLGLDPGFRTGVKVAVVDGTGKVVDTCAIFPHQPQKQWDAAKATLGGARRPPRRRADRRSATAPRRARPMRWQPNSSPTSAPPAPKHPRRRW